jgi:ribosomal protein L27
MREIKFRGKRIYDGIFVEGDLIHGVNHKLGKTYILPIRGGVMALGHGLDPMDGYEVIPESVGQYIGLKSKSGEDVYDGHEVSYKIPYRTTQTHTGDNIPNGSYTEPMEPDIKTVYGVVKYKDGTFYLDTDEDVFGGMIAPVSWHHTEWDLEGIKDAISWTRRDDGWFDDPEEGDLQYLITECAKVDTPEQLIEFLSGFEIIGNIFENPELINK